MFSKANRKSFITVILFVMVLSVSALFVGVKFGTDGASAAESDNIGRTYYYCELKNSPLAQKFYNVMKEMSEKGYFEKGTYEYDLADVVTQSDLSAYASGAPKITVALGAARDAFYFDNPDLFYADVYKLVPTVSMANGKYTATLGTGNRDNYYNDNTVSSAAEVEDAVNKYNKALGDLVAATRAASSDVVEQIKFVNKEISEMTEYSYGAYYNKHNELEYNGYVVTSYGALVEHEALCDGYARAFKAVMDRLDIPCVIIGGSAYSGIGAIDAETGEELKAGYESHAWNAVKVEGLWYAVDVTWNDTGNNLNKYTLVGNDFISQTHVGNNVISSSGFELKYPAIRPLGYGVNADTNGFVYKDSGKIGEREFGYDGKIGEDNVDLLLGVSYEGKNAEQLIEDGKYLAYKYVGTDTWYGFDNWVKWMELNVDMTGIYVDIYSTLSLNWSVQGVQFAVFDFAPDQEVADLDGTKYTLVYNNDSLTPDHIIAMGAVYNNEAYGGYYPAPYVQKMTPDEKGSIKDFNPLTITIKYSEQLVYEDDNDTTVTVTVTGTTHSDVAEYAVADNVNWNAETNTLSFRFTPSRQLSHNSERYCFVPTNLVGKNSRKVPDAANLSFERKTIVCPKVFNDGRLYMKVYGQPQFVSASDESLNDFKGKDGQPIVGDQRSQLMLVINEPTKAESESMEQAAKNKFGLTDNDIKASSTYQIDLTMCGMVQKVPAGSFMQVGFGFPEGYSLEQGIAFTVYHYTRKPNGEIDTVEAVPCVVTEYGIIATVKSFSPFMICAIDSAKAPTYKAVYANVNGVGGKVDKSDIQTLNSGDEITYTITPDAGYDIASIMLNGTDVTAQLSTSKTLKLGYSDLQNNNELEITFISDRVAEYRTQNNINVIQPKIIVKNEDMFEAVAVEAGAAAPTPKNDNTTVIVISVVVIIAVALIGGCVAFYLIMRKKKMQKAEATSASGNKTSAKSNNAVKNNNIQRKTDNVNKSVAATKTASRLTAASRNAVTQNRPTTSGATQNRTATMSNRVSSDRSTSGTAQNRATTTQSRPTTMQTRSTGTQTIRPTDGTANRSSTQNKPTANRPAQQHNSRPNTANTHTRRDGNGTSNTRK